MDYRQVVISEKLNLGSTRKPSLFVYSPTLSLPVRFFDFFQKRKDALSSKSVFSAYLSFVDKITYFYEKASLAAMTSFRKLSTFLNRYYSYHHLKDAKSEEIQDITFEFIARSEKKIYKQPAIALRAIKVEMIDIYRHYNRYTKELKQYQLEQEGFLSNGPKISPDNLEKVKELEEKINVLVEFVYALEDSFAYMTRMLLEHYSESEIDKAFLNQFSQYLGRHDWMSKRTERFLEKANSNSVPDFGSAPFDKGMVEKARKLVSDNEVYSALTLLLSNTKDHSIVNNLVFLKRQWMDCEEQRISGMITSEESSVTKNKIVSGILLLLEPGPNSK